MALWLHERNTASVPLLSERLLLRLIGTDGPGRWRPRSPGRPGRQRWTRKLFARRLLGHIEHRTTDLADDVLEVGTGSYSPEHHALEVEVLFRNQPLANVCRHRGVRVADDAGRARNFTCPFHAWTYDLGGRLVAVPTARHLPGELPLQLPAPPDAGQVRARRRGDLRQLRAAPAQPLGRADDRRAARAPRVGVGRRVPAHQPAVRAVPEHQPDLRSAGMPTCGRSCRSRPTCPRSCTPPTCAPA